MSENHSSPKKPSSALLNIALLTHVIRFAATSVRRTTQLSFLNSTWSDCIANFSDLAWERLFQSEPNTATRIAMRSCNLGLFEIARVVAGNPTAARIRDSSNWSCLHQASFCGRPGTCSLLLQMDETDVDAQTSNGWTPVRCAVYNSDTSVMRVLCSSGMKMPSMVGDDDHDDDVQEQPSYFQQQAHRKVVDLNKCCSDGDTPLIACVTAGLDSRLAMIDAMLETCLREKEQVKKNEDDDKKDNDCENARPSRNLKQIVNTVNPKTGLSALFVALKNRDIPCAELLIKKYGADIEQRDPFQKRTALLFIAAAPDVVAAPMIKFLLDCGAEMDSDQVRDNLGNSVFELVSGKKARSVIEEEAKKRGLKIPV